MQPPHPAPLHAATALAQRATSRPIVTPTDDSKATDIQRENDMTRSTLHAGLIAGLSCRHLPRLGRLCGQARRHHGLGDAALRGRARLPADGLARQGQQSRGLRRGLLQRPRQGARRDGRDRGDDLSRPHPGAGLGARRRGRRLHLRHAGAGQDRGLHDPLLRLHQRGAGEEGGQHRRLRRAEGPHGRLGGRHLRGDRAREQA